MGIGSVMASDNIAGATSKGLLGIFLLPGKVWQWFMYMGVGSLRGYGEVRAQTRLARSPIMTWVFSLISWAVIIFLIIGHTLDP